HLLKNCTQFLPGTPKCAGLFCSFFQTSGAGQSFQPKTLDLAPANEYDKRKVRYGSSYLSKEGVLMLQAIGWLIATIVLVFIEATTFNLVSVWFAVGGAAALISCIFTDSLRVQSAIFVAVSILCLLALRPLAARLRRPLTPTNGDLNIGRTATVLTS